MEENSLISKLSQYVLDNHDVSITKNNKILIDRASCSGTGANTKFIKVVINPNKDAMLKIDKRLVFMGDSELKDFIGTYLEAIQTEIINKVTNEQKEKIKEEQGVNTIHDLCMKAIPVVHMSAGGSVHPDYFMVDKDNGRVIPNLTYSAWKTIMPAQIVKMHTEEIKHVGDLEYNPYNMYKFNHVENPNGSFTKFNLYNPPAWKMQELEEQADLHPLFIKFFDTLFASERARQYAIDWLWTSTNSMVPVYFCMIGAPGVGKNICAEAAAKLHGDFNFEKAKDSHPTDKFNNHLENKTFCLYDEINLHKAGKADTARARLKEWCNHNVSIEKKGKNSISQKIYTSCFILTNYMTNLPVEFNDRKFSIIDLTNKRVENRGFTTKDIDFLVNSYIGSDPKFPGAFAKFLNENKSEDFNPNIPYKGDSFRKLVITSLNGWQQALRSTLLSKEAEEYDYSYLKDNIPFLPSIEGVADFLINYKEIRKSDDFEKDQDYLHNANENGMSLGHVKYLTSGNVIVANKEIFDGVKRKEIDLP